MEKVFGIDISKYQKGIDFGELKKEGVKFIIVRAGFTGATDGISKYKDECFESFYRKAKEYEIPVGAYWYSCATTYELGKKEAEYMINYCLKGKTFEYPIAIDVEDNKNQKIAGKKAITEAIKGFAEYMEEQGYYVIIYANSNWFTNYIDLELLKKYDIWLASWSNRKPNSPSAGMWQFGGETNKIRSNKIDGITCDQNYAYLDYPNIMMRNGLNGYKIDNSLENSKKDENVNQENILSILERIKFSFFKLLKFVQRKRN